MAYNLDITELAALYAQLGSARAVWRWLRDKSGGDVPSVRTIQYRLKNITQKKPAAKAKPDDRPVAAGELYAPDTMRPTLAGRAFVFTSAQNNTFVHETFLESLLVFCKHRGAELVVGTFSYNKNGFQNANKDDDGLWYDERIRPYISNGSAWVGTEVVYCGELDILPTATNPLSGFESYTRGKTGIIPHAKVQMQSLLRLPSEAPRFLYTTGAVTLRNYIERKAGQKAAFHHVFGALYVYIDDDGDWFARQLIADDDGSFYDLLEKFTPDGVVEVTSMDERPAITWGDIHVEKEDADVAHAAWYGEDSMLSVLRPPVQFVHDVTDFAARNHHSLHDPVHLARQHFSGKASVRKELIDSGVFLATLARKVPGSTVVVVESNHHAALERWLREADVRKDPDNAEVFHELNAYMYRILGRGLEPNIYRWALTRFAAHADYSVLTSRVEFLKVDEPYAYRGVEHSMHGHRGPNGARGNPRAMRGVGNKVNMGHTHSAGIIDGVYVAGVSASLDMGYNKGPTSWSHSHILTYANGKRAIITMRGQKWR